MARLSPAGRRYIRRFVPAMIFYCATIFAVARLVRGPHAPKGWALDVAAVLPALPILAVIWAMGRFLVEETDEYLRAQQVRAMLWGLGLTLAVTTVWGFLETYAAVPHFPAYCVFILFCVGMGLAQCAGKLTEFLAERR